MLPEGNTLSTQNYDAKKILCPMGMEYKRIHTCPNDYILYRKEFEDLKKCPKCGSSRYKQKRNSEDNGQIEKEGSALKVVWHLPIVPRLKRLFANPKDAKNLRWHATERRCDGLLHHAADSMQWKNIDQEFEFWMCYKIFCSGLCWVLNKICRFKCGNNIKTKTVLKKKTPY